MEVSPKGDVQVKGRGGGVFRVTVEKVLEPGVLCESGPERHQNHILSAQPQHVGFVVQKEGRGRGGGGEPARRSLGFGAAAAEHRNQLHRSYEKAGWWGRSWDNTTGPSQYLRVFKIRAPTSCGAASSIFPRHKDPYDIQV